MINKYQFLSDPGTQKTVVSIFISGDYASVITPDSTNNIIDVYLSYGEFDASSNKINNFYPYDGHVFTERLPDNNYSIKPGGVLTLTGYTIVQDLLKIYSLSDKNIFANNTTNYIKSITNPYIKLGFVFEDVYNNDTYVNINLNRNFGSLETLTIKNNAVGSWNSINSSTGIVFGTLLANQKINDENGNPIQIPLRNVPILIFNKTDTNITTSNPSQDGRTPINMIDNSPRELYTNDFSYNFDKQILPKVTTKNVTNVYQYSTITNEKGEYILKDVPTGVQTMIIEIDLLKQGLTQEEIELNVAPFPKTNNLTPQQSPSLIYREIPIEVLPSWGTLNTGYTNVDIKLNVDLRKWTTYFVPPVTAYQKTYTEILQSGFQPNLSIRVRDMASKGVGGEIFPNKNIECVVIPDVKKRDYTRLLGWTNEQRQLSDLIVFNNLEFNAFKLPANIYDSDSYKTDGSGNTINNKGVWLSSYEFKMFFTKEDSFYRATGFNLGTVSIGRTIGQGKPNMMGGFGGAIQDASGKIITINNQNNFDLTNNNTSSTGVTIGVFPYEKPWSTDYPIRYSIPKLPIKINSGITENYNKQKQRAGEIGNGKPDLNSSSGATDILVPTNMLIPKYLDGDRIGSQIILDSIKFGGWGAQSNFAGDVYPNYFAQQVTTSELYRYEAAISTLDEFSNGYTPNYQYGQVPTGQTSNVLNGEVYQRVECGHAYFMWIQGYPRIISLSGYDTMYTADFLPASGQTGATSYKGQKPLHDNYLENNTLFNNDTLLSTDFIQVKDIQKGYIYLYKITDPDPNLLAPPTPPLQRRGIKLNFHNVYMQRGGHAERARAVIGTSDSGHRFKFKYFNQENDDTKSKAVLRIKNLGVVSVDINIGINNQKVEPNQFFDFPLIDVSNDQIITLPTNDVYDFSVNTYYNTNYDLSIHNLQFYFPNGNNAKFIPDLTPNFSITNDGITEIKNINISGNTLLEGLNTYHLVSKITEIRVRGPIGTSKPDGLVIDCDAKVDIQGLVLISSDISRPESYEFRPAVINTDGGNGDNLPYHVLNTL